MRIVLDTNVFGNLAFCGWLRDCVGIEKMIPCIAYMELVYHHLKKGQTEDYTDAFMRVHGITVVPLDAEIARASARSAVGRWDFKEKARDYTIGATAIIWEAKLATYNKRDFEWLPKGRVVSPEELMGLKSNDLSSA